MAVLLNQASNLRFRLDIARRLSDGVQTPAALEVEVAIERYRHRPTTGEHAFVPLLRLPQATVLDLDLIQFLENLEALLDSGKPGGAALEGSSGAAVGLHISGGPDAYQIEAGLDLRSLLETVGGQGAEAGSDVALVRFFANGRAVVAFCAALLEEFARFPTDPSRVSPGEAG
ncbi:MAG TPA: hypothetical protein VG496_04735 [Myxococcales bacterium]|nr:hypothetical protein [Myxococcales bacterium]